MVVTFTFITVTCTVLLQLTPYAIRWDEVMGGLTFEFPSVVIFAAMACFAGTGVGANEQMAYTYWCVENGYARFAGPADASDDWVRLANGWIRVMHTDVKLTLILLACTTIPFYMLGAACFTGLGRSPTGLRRFLSCRACTPRRRANGRSACFWWARSSSFSRPWWRGWARTHACLLTAWRPWG